MNHWPLLPERASPPTVPIFNMLINKINLLGSHCRIVLAQAKTLQAQTWIATEENGKYRTPTNIRKHHCTARPSHWPENRKSMEHLQVNDCDSASSTFSAPARSRQIVRQ